MFKRGPRYSGEVMQQRGEEIYNRDILPSTTPGDKGKYVAIDIETGMFEMDDDDMKAVYRLYDRRPEAQPWMLRIGYRYLEKLGPYRDEA